MALGAQASNLCNMVMRRGTLTLIGVLIDGGGAFWLTHLLADFLFGVKPLGPVSFIATRWCGVSSPYSLFGCLQSELLGSIQWLRSESNERSQTICGHGTEGTALSEVPGDARLGDVRTQSIA
jgi:hypothetical protein